MHAVTTIIEYLALLLVFLSNLQRTSDDSLTIRTDPENFLAGVHGPSILDRAVYPANESKQPFT